jgi:hypothetical protein
MVERVLMSPGGATEETLGDVLAELEEPLGLDDSVRQTLRILTPLSQVVGGPQTDLVLIPIAAGSRLRLLRNAGHCDPALDLDVYPTVTLKIGATTIWRDKLEAGLPWSETVCFEGSDGEDLTVSVDATASIYLNLRYEVFPT